MTTATRTAATAQPAVPAPTTAPGCRTATAGRATSTASGSHWEVYNDTGIADGRDAAVDARSSTRASGRARSRTSRATSASSRTTGGATALATGRRRRRPTARRGSSATSAACSTRPGRTGDARRPVRRRGAGRRSSSRRATRNASRGIVAFAVGVPFLSPPHPWPVQRTVSHELRGVRGLGKGEPATTGVQDYRGLRGLLLREILPEPHSTKGIEDAGRVGRRRVVDAMPRDAAGRRAIPTDRRRSSRGARHPLPDAARPRHEGPLPAVSRAFASPSPPGRRSSSSRAPST